MKDILGTKHECGGTFKEINIWEDIACDKCGHPSERYIYTPEEEISRRDAEIARLKDRIIELESRLEKIALIAR